MAELCTRIHKVASDAQAFAVLASPGQCLAAAVAALDQASAWIRINKGSAALGAASAYFRLAGDVAGGWVLVRNALLLARADDARLPTMALLAEIYAHGVLALAPGRAVGLMQNLAAMAELSVDALGG